MKAVFLNDLKKFKNQTIAILASIAIMTFLFLVFPKESKKGFYLYWMSMTVFIMRGQVIFGDLYNDVDKFLTMPISAEDYVLGKIIRNLFVYFFTTVVFFMFLLNVKGKVNKEILEIYLFYFVSIDFLLISLNHMIFSKHQKSFIYVFYILTVLLVGLPMLRYSKILLNYKIISTILTIIVPIISFYADYKISLKYLKEGQII